MSFFPVMESVEGRTSSPESADVRLMMSHSARTADGHTDDPTGASSQPEAFPAGAVAAEESSPTEKQKKRKKRIRALFRGIGKAMCRVFCRGEDDIVSPFPCSDPTDVQPDISGLKWALSLSVSDMSSYQLSPVPSFCNIELTPDVNLDDPEPSPVPGPSALDSGIPGPSGSGAAFEKWKKKKGIAALFRRMGKSLFTSCCNEDDAKCSDSTDVQPDLSGIKGPGPSALESEIPDPSGSGAALEKQEKKKKGIGAFLHRFRMGNKVAPDSFAKSVLGPSSLELTPDMGLVEPKPVPGAPDVEPAPGPSSSWPPTESFSSFYEVKRELGSGCSGTVYEGMRRFDGQKVAIKFILKKPWKRFIELPGSTEPLLAEVAVNLLLRRPPKSPYIVQMLDWFEQPEKYVLITEYPHPCETLHNFTIMRNGGFLDETVARGLMRQAVLAAKHCIDCGIDHNDIHTSNILINTETQQLKFIDFGISQLFQTSEGHERAVQMTVWSLGRVLLEMVSGDHQFHILKSGKCDPQCPSLSKDVKKNSFITRCVLCGSKRTDISAHKNSSSNLKKHSECRDLIKQCLAPRNKILTLEQILEHPWFDQN